MTAVEAAPGHRPALPLRCAARGALPLALLLWLLSLRHVDLDRMGDLGLLQVLPALYWAAVLLLTVGFTVALYLRGVGRAWLAAYVLGLIAVIHATPAVLYANMRYAWAWKHVAVINAMIRHNGPVPDAGPLAIYNQWPGFFNLNGLFLRATGLHSPLGYAAWTPPVANALLLGPLLLLYRSVSRERTLVWGGAWIFYCCSWVGQDYFSPQAFAFLLYVVLLAVVFRELPPARGNPEAADDLAADAPAADRVAVRGWTAARLAPLLLIEAVIISSHQLTPLMLITALAALSLPRANRRVTLPLLGGALAMELLWGLTVARPYIAGNLKNFSAALLSPDTNAVSGFAGLSSAAPGQVVVDWADRALSAAVLLLALLSFLRRRWVRRTGLPLVALSPIPLLAANSYGGEMLFRVYLFALPATAFLAAALVLRPRPRPDLRLLGALGLLLALLCGLFLGYDSKEEMNRFTTGEVDAARYVTGTAPVGAVLVALTDNVPGIYEHYEDHPLVQLGQQGREAVALLVHDPLAGLRQALSATPPGTPAYLVLTRAQAAECYLTGILPADTMARLEAAVAGRPGFTTVYRNPDAVVYRFVPVPLVPVPPLPVPVPPAPVPAPIAP
ncbi:hypothetical protein [Streptacidiphilus albus]|uniref:hypothetical protein n=1 Tax=Streptacidiphilus albus TaxID=105425 RepID=UPI00068D5154|nr:hypothetical protein [Streptacidiphilus albus]